MIHRCAPVLLAALCVSCVGVPSGVEVVRGFELERYLGTWYEIARLDHRFERGLTDVTATYSMREDGGVSVLNRGYSAEEGIWKEAAGRAYFVGETDVAQLKVSFFGPFFGGYNVIALDPDYRHAVVVGPNRSYLWVLAREPSVDPGVLERLLDVARSADFPVEALIFVSHDRRQRHDGAG